MSGMELAWIAFAVCVGSVFAHNINDLAGTYADKVGEGVPSFEFFYFLIAGVCFAVLAGVLLMFDRGW